MLTPNFAYAIAALTRAARLTLALRKGLADAENPPVKVRAAMTAFRRPIWAVMVPNVHRASPLDCASVRFGMVCRMVW